MLLLARYLAQPDENHVFYVSWVTKVTSSQLRQSDFCINNQQTVFMKMFATAHHFLIAWLCLLNRSARTFFAVHFTNNTQPVTIDIFLQLLIFCTIKINGSVSTYNSISVGLPILDRELPITANLRWCPRR